VELDAKNLMSDAGAFGKTSGSLYMDAKGKLNALGAWKQKVDAAVCQVCKFYERERECVCV